MRSICAPGNGGFHDKSWIVNSDVEQVPFPKGGDNAEYR